MYLICFQPFGQGQFVPQGLCYSEQQAKEWLKNVPTSVFGTYIYMFVPLLEQGNYWQRREYWQFPGYVPQPAYPYELPAQISDFPPGPIITC